MNNQHGRVILVGIDGADWKILHRLKPYLPNINYLVENGASSIVESTIPPFSPIAWNSLFTGMEPHNHGILGFVQPEVNSYNYRIINSTCRKAKALWNYCTDNGLKGIYLNIPFTYPPEAVSGILISGLGTPSNLSAYSYPKEFKNYLLKKFKHFKVDYEENKYNIKSDEFLNNAFEILKEEIRVGGYLFNSIGDWKVFACVFRLTDVLQHYYWHDMEKIKQAYVYIDTFIGQLLKKLKKEDTVMVVSDHGFCHAGRCFYVNNWLAEKGYLYLPARKRAKSAVFYKITRWIQGSPLRKYAIALLTTRFFKRYIKNIPMGGFDILDKIDERTKAYFVPGSCTSITVNLKGRQPRGGVEQKDYDKIIENLIADLLELKDGSGNGNTNVVKKAFKIKDLYGISEIKDIVYDIVFLLSDGYVFRSHDEQRTILKDIDTDVTATHNSESVFIAFGNRIKKGKLEEGAICNILPTILNLLGISTSEPLDGSIWTEILE